MEYQNYLKLLNEFISFKSISTDPAYKGEIDKTVAWLKTLFITSGFEVEVFNGPVCNPVVLANYSPDKNKETILIYGHYDVQPAEVEDGWNSDPFKVFEKNNRLYARGIVDNKGQILVHIATVLGLIKENKLKYNVKFLIEGNEETSNDDLPSIIKANKSKMSADYILISDGEIIDDNPVLEYSLRGGFNCTLKYTTAKNNLHSGIYGGAIPNAANELSKFVASLYDKNNKVTVPSFYSKVDSISSKQVKNNKSILKDKESVFEMTGAKAFLMEKGLDFYTQIGLRPTIQVTGFKAGYISEGYANIVPATAEVRLNFRIVTSQKSKDVIKAFETYVKKVTPNYVTYELKCVHPHEPIKIDVNSSKAKEVVKLLKKSFNKEVLVKPVGGAIPVVSDFKNILGKDTLLVSLGNEDCNMHGANENYKIDLINKGLSFSKSLFSQ